MLVDYLKAKSLLERYGIRSVRSRYVKSADEAIDFAGRKRIVLKALSEKELHKSKAGLVRLDLGNAAEIKKAYNELESRSAGLGQYKIIAQEMAQSGAEVILGGREDSQFGKLVLIGLGGIYVEAFRDFALRTCPITRYDAAEMLGQLRACEVITHHGKATAMVERLLLQISALLERNRWIKELDLNPVILREDSYDVVDIRVLR